MERDAIDARGDDALAARIPMTDEAVLAVLREHFAGVDSMYLCPLVPGKKEIAARRLHARHLPSEERVLALFDDTVFGSGDEGFVVTSRRVCWRNAGTSARPQMIEWRHLDPDLMYVDRGKLVLGLGAIEVGEPSALDALEATFYVLALSARAPTSAASRASATESGIAQAVPAARAARLSDRPTLRPSRPPPPLESEVVPRSDRKFTQAG